MTFPVVSTAGHQGKSLVVDPGRETINVHDTSGQLLGSMSWGAIIERVLVSGEDARFAHCRTQPRAPLALKVRYTTPEGKQFDSLTGGIGGGGLFIREWCSSQSGHRADSRICASGSAVGQVESEGEGRLGPQQAGAIPFVSRHGHSVRGVG